MHLFANCCKLYNSYKQFPHHHVKAKSLIRFVHNPVFGLSVQFQLIHPASVKLLEAFVTVDSLKMVEIQTFSC